MVRGVQNALASLHHASAIQFSRWAASAACSAGAGSSSATRDTNSRPSSSATPSSQSAHEVNNDSKPRQGNKKPQSLGRKNASGSRTRIVTRDRKHKLKTRHLACPFQKEDIIHGRHTTCSYEGADSMSTLRKHLAGQQHRDSLPFIDLCSSCKEYVASLCGKAFISWGNVYPDATSQECRSGTHLQIRPESAHSGCGCLRVYSRYRNGYLVPVSSVSHLLPWYSLTRS
jgi:hypothetical protein